MFKKFLLCFIILLVIVSSACAEVRLWYENYALGSVKDGKSDWSDARFGHAEFGVADEDMVLTQEIKDLTGTITVSGGNYSFWNGSGITMRKGYATSEGISSLSLVKVQKVL